MSQFETFFIIESLDIKLECIRSFLQFYPLNHVKLRYKAKKGDNPKLFSPFLYLRIRRAENNIRDLFRKVRLISIYTSLHVPCRHLDVDCCPILANNSEWRSGKRDRLMLSLLLVGLSTAVTLIAQRGNGKWPCHLREQPGDK